MRDRAKASLPPRRKSSRSAGPRASRRPRACSSHCAARPRTITPTSKCPSRGPTSPSSAETPARR
eukprot:7958000-Pyramimonas_sp.AAC.1